MGGWLSADDAVTRARARADFGADTAEFFLEHATQRGWCLARQFAVGVEAQGDDDAFACGAFAFEVEEAKALVEVDFGALFAGEFGVACEGFEELVGEGELEFVVELEGAL